LQRKAQERSEELEADSTLGIPANANATTPMATKPEESGQETSQGPRESRAESRRSQQDYLKEKTMKKWSSLIATRGLLYPALKLS